MTAMSTLKAIAAAPEFTRPDVEPVDRHPTNNLCRDLPARMEQSYPPEFSHSPIRTVQGMTFNEPQRDWHPVTRGAAWIGIAVMLVLTCALWGCDPMEATAGCGPSVCVMPIGEE